jgi:hypothetical protein
LRSEDAHHGDEYVIGVDQSSERLVLEENFDGDVRRMLDARPYGFHEEHPLVFAVPYASVVIFVADVCRERDLALDLDGGLVAVDGDDLGSPKLSMRPVIDWGSFVGNTDGQNWYDQFTKCPWEDPVH